MFIKKFYIIILFSIVFISKQAYSQDNTFSKLYPMRPYPAANFNAVVVTDTAYFMIGVVSDSVQPYGAKPLFVRTDTDGDVEIVKVVKRGINNYETWHAGMYFDDLGRIVTNGYIFNNPNKKENFFIRYLQNGEVDTLVEFDYSTINTDVTYPMISISGKRFIVPINSNPNIYASNIILTLDNNGNVIDTIVHNQKHGNLLLIRMDTTKYGFILGGWASPLGPVKNGIHQTIITEFDTDGNKIWEYESPTDEDWCGTLGGIIVNDDDEIIYVSGQGYINNPNSVSDYFNYKWYATKLDRDKNIIWRTLIPSTKESPAETCRFWNVLKLKDGKSYITMGMDFKAEPRYFGWLAKFNDAGELIWNRKYNVEDRKSIGYEIRDLAEDIDGNLIAVGERLYWDTISFNAQQAWLMKLDKHGCLVPGCHLVNTKETSESQIAIKLYPNPTSDFISFYINQHENQKINQYCIRDLSGKIVKVARSIEQETTYVLHIQDLSSGCYFIQFLNNGQIVQSEKFIVSH